MMKRKETEIRQESNWSRLVNWMCQRNKNDIGLLEACVSNLICITMLPYLGLRPGSNLQVGERTARIMNRFLY